MVVAPNRGFSRSSNLPVSLEFTPNRPLLPWQRKLGNFSTKLARTRLIQGIEPRMLNQQGFFEVLQFTGVIEFTSDRPLLPWQRKIVNFSTKLARTHLIQEIEPRMLHQTGVFEVKQLNGNVEIYISPPPVAMATKL